MRIKTLLVIVALTLFVCAPAAFGQNLLTNGSFETGDFTGWTVNGLEEVTSGNFYVYTGAQQGTFYAVFGNVGSDGSISQSFSDQAGQSYTFSFWLAAVGDNPSDFSASWDGTTVYSAQNPNTGGVYQLFTFTEVGTGNDTITFSGRDDPAWIALDNVSVTPQGGTSVPEPSSILLMGSGVLGLSGVIRRKLRG
jgi:hypothetical protein